MARLQGTEHHISKLVGKAMTDYEMIADGDKIAVAVSGGKDSLSLLKLLKDRQKFVPIKYELLAVHVDMGYPCHHPKMLAEYFKKIGVEYHIEKIDILKGKSRKDISCFWCSWNRRKALFEVTKRFNCTKLALGHHKDDIIETILMNMFFNGEISGMNPKQELFKGVIKIIRPLAYVDEDLIVKLAKTLEFPHHKCVCPNALTSKRTKITKMIRSLKKDCPDVKTNIFRSIKRIRSEYLL
ncbi:MAG: ATP-binding protein [Candidatus Omnitrophota bacterium]